MPNVTLPPLSMLYVALSAMIAMGIFVQIVLLRQNNGRLPPSPLFHVLSFFDTVWVLTSAAALYFLDFDKLAIAVPVVYGLYTFVGFFYAARTITGTKSDMPANPDDIVFDVRYLNFCQSFAMVFFGFCLMVILVHYELISLPSGLLSQ